MLRFLIDENISRKRRTVAVERGYEAFHVRELGLLGRPDWALISAWPFQRSNLPT